MSKKKQLMKVKKVGANLAIILGKERLAKKVTKEESASIIKNVENYNKAIETGRAEKTIAKWDKLVHEAMTSNTKKAKAKKEEDRVARKKIQKRVAKAGKRSPATKANKAESTLLKDIKQSAKKESQSTLQKGIAYLQGLLTKNKNMTKPKATIGRRRSGEH